jgi:type III pantothenate kinase
MQITYLVDAGNTSIKVQRPDTRVTRFSSFEDILEEKIFANGDRVFVVSVRSLQSTKDFINQLESKGVNVVNVTWQSKGLLKTCYENPASLGIDRLVAASAAAKLGQNLLVVDIGTAVTFDFVQDNVHMGGFIVPGVALMVDSLLQNTAKAGTAIIDPASNWQPAITTAAAVNEGAYNAIAAQIEYHARRWQQKGATICLTGGNARHIQAYLAIDCIVVDNLVFEGLALVAQLEK